MAIDFGVGTPVRSLKKSAFDLTHERKLSCDMGELVPIMVEEVLPGDYFKNSSSMVVRLSPLLAPIMHRIDVYTHFFFVPNRLVWADWEDFITGGDDGTDTTTWPYIGVTNASIGTLWDYMGLPTGVANELEVSALPFRAYSLIYNEWYRNQWLQTELAISTGNGDDTTTNTTLQKRNWEKDYYTSALESPQKGTAVDLPIGTSAPLVGDDTTPTMSNDTDATARDLQTHTNADVVLATAPSATDDANWENVGAYADLSSATAATINEVREAFQIQKWMEVNARGGSRYVESILAHFGVRSSDSRLQRPEYLGGGKSPVVISEVLQTSASDTGTSSQTPQGTMVGHGFSAQVSHEFNREFEEHGLIIGIMSIMPRTAYQEGIERKWNRDSRYDYYWPEFAALGEQAVINQEIYAQGTAADTTTFGYQGRYDEYRRSESKVCGDFRDALDHWHMGRQLGSLPTLNSAFITCTPTTRVFATSTDDTCLVQLVNKLTAVRLMPKVASPAGF